MKGVLALELEEFGAGATLVLEQHMQNRAKQLKRVYESAIVT